MIQSIRIIKSLLIFHQVLVKGENAMSKKQALLLSLLFLFCIIVVIQADANSAILGQDISGISNPSFTSVLQQPDSLLSEKEIFPVMPSFTPVPGIIVKATQGEGDPYVDGTREPSIANSTLTPTPTMTATQPGACDYERALHCGEQDSYNNSGPGSTNQIDTYSCSDWYESGPEYVYQFAPQVSSPVTVNLSNLTADLDIFILFQASGSCNANDCIAYGDISASFYATEGRIYYFAVDGRNGAVSDYTISVECDVVEFSRSYLPLVVK